MFFVFILPILIITGIIKLLNPTKRKSIRGKHVVVTGGSSGIGKAVAILAASEGAHVTIIARDIENLNKAQNQIKEYTINEDQIITKVSVDVSHCTEIENNLSELEETVGPIYMLVNCAGMAICGKVEDFSEQDIKMLIDINFLGTLFPIQAMVPKFKQRKEGIIVLTASQAALLGIYGYSIYSSCKFALRGLAESLNMEVKPYGITVTLVLPPDTNTPGLRRENKTKPLETQKISESAGLHDPLEVGRKLLDDALTGQFFSYVGFESFILTTLCVGMSPFSSYFNLLLESVSLGVLRLVGAFYINSFDKIVKKCYREKELNVKNKD